MNFLDEFLAVEHLRLSKNTKRHCEWNEILGKHELCSSGKIVRNRFELIILDKN